jgi:hypothetical protein
VDKRQDIDYIIDIDRLLVAVLLMLHAVTHEDGEYLHRLEDDHFIYDT